MLKNSSFNSHFKVDILHRIGMMSLIRTINRRRYRNFVASNVETSQDQSEVEEVRHWQRVAYTRLTIVISEAFEQAQTTEDAEIIRQIVGSYLTPPFKTEFSLSDPDTLRATLLSDDQLHEWTTSDKEKYMQEGYWEQKFSELLEEKGWEHLGILDPSDWSCQFTQLNLHKKDSLMFEPEM